MLFLKTAKDLQRPHVVHVVEPDAFLDGRLRADDEARVGGHQPFGQIDVTLDGLVVKLGVELFVPRVAVLLDHDDLGVPPLVFIAVVGDLTSYDG